MMSGDRVMSMFVTTTVQFKPSDWTRMPPGKARAPRPQLVHHIRRQAGWCPGALSSGAASGPPSRHEFSAVLLAGAGQRTEGVFYVFRGGPEMADVDEVVEPYLLRLH